MSTSCAAGPGPGSCTGSPWSPALGPAASPGRGFGPPDRLGSTEGRVGLQGQGQSSVVSDGPGCTGSSGSPPRGPGPGWRRLSSSPGEGRGGLPWAGVRTGSRARMPRRPPTSRPVASVCLPESLQAGPVSTRLPALRRSPFLFASSWEHVSGKTTRFLCSRGHCGSQGPRTLQEPSGRPGSPRKCAGALHLCLASPPGAHGRPPGQARELSAAGLGGLRPPLAPTLQELRPPVGRLAPGYGGCPSGGPTRDRGCLRWTAPAGRPRFPQGKRTHRRGRILGQERALTAWVPPHPRSRGMIHQPEIPPSLPPPRAGAISGRPGGDARGCLEPRGEIWATVWI